MYDLDPVELNKQFIQDGVYQNGCMISDDLAAKSLGVEFDGRTTTMPTFMCIAETDNYKSSGVPQHFFVWLGQGNMIMDPLTGTIKTNNYHIISFRLFKERTNMNHEQVISTIRDARNSLFGHLENTGAENDAKWVDGEFAKGNQYALGQIIKTYATCAEFKSIWMKKVDCKPTVCDPSVVCKGLIDPKNCECGSQVQAEQDRIVKNIVG